METGIEVGGGSSASAALDGEEKRRIVEDTLSSTRSLASLARQHGVNANQLFYWRKLYHAGQLCEDQCRRTGAKCSAASGLGRRR